MSEFKKLAAEKAVDYIKSGMIIGLGTGSTTYFALLKISELLKSGGLINIKGIPSSTQTENQAKELNIPLTNLKENPVIDLTIDGADEIDADLNLIKGGGGALLREKIIAQASRKEIIIADDSKFSDKLGTKWAVPIEVIEFAVESEIKFLESIGSTVKPRISDNTIFKTDEGNVILDADFGTINSPVELALKLERRAGIVEHGLFINLADIVIIAGKEGIRVHNK